MSNEIDKKNTCANATWTIAKHGYESDAKNRIRIQFLIKTFESFGHGLHFNIITENSFLDVHVELKITTVYCTGLLH